MKKILLLSIAASMMFLAGCKTKVQTPVSYTEIFSEPKTKIGVLEVEVPSCTDLSNKFESNSVIEAKQKIPYVIPEAKYEKCYNQDFHSFAVFNVPFQVGGVKEDCKDNQVCVYHSHNGVYGNIMVGKEILSRAKEISRSFNGNDLEFSIILDNDTGNKLNLFIIAAFSGGQPFYKTDVTVNKDAKNVDLLMDNVGASVLLQGNYVNMFLDRDKEKSFLEQKNNFA